MPIKLKCSCGQVLSVPDKMAGKSGNCPKCKKPIKIPVPKAKVAKPATAGSATAAKAAVRQSSETGGRSNSGLDSLFEEAGLTRQKGPICKNCGAPIKPGTVLCTGCGFNFETGESLSGFRALADKGPEFDNLHLQEAANNMSRELVMEDRREKANMPWWVIMSFLIGAMSLCAAGVIIVDGQLGEPSPADTLIGKIQRWPVFVTLGLTALITGTAISVFAHLNIVAFAFLQEHLARLRVFHLATDLLDHLRHYELD